MVVHVCGNLSVMDGWSVVICWLSLPGHLLSWYFCIANLWWGVGCVFHMSEGMLGSFVNVATLLLSWLWNGGQGWFFAC